MDTRTGHQYDPQQHGGWYEGETPPPGRPADAGKPMHPAPGLAHDLARMADTAASLDTPIVFVTYPMRQQRPLNREIEHAAFERGVPLIDGILELERAVHDGHAIPALIDRSAALEVPFFYRIRPKFVKGNERWHSPRRFPRSAEITRSTV